MVDRRREREQRSWAGGASGDGAGGQRLLLTGDGAINAAGERVAVFPAAYSGEPLSHDVLITGLGDVDEVTVEWYEASSENEGLEPLKTDSYGVENGAFTVSVETPEYGVVGMRILQ